jgi:RNA polymerase sigma-70 factor (ECF subfamily)
MNDRPGKPVPARVPSEPPATADSTELVARAQAGESGALDQLLGRYLPRLRAWATRRVPAWARDGMDTADLVQDTVLHTYKRIPGFEPQRDGALLGYLRRALVNRIRDQFRAAARHPGRVPLEDRHAGTGASPLSRVIDQEDRERYRRALIRLKPADRKAIVARLELGYSYEQLALVLMKPTPEAARLAVRRALERLAAEMARG